MHCIAIPNKQHCNGESAALLRYEVNRGRDKWVRCFFLHYSSFPCRCPCVRTAAAAKKGHECEEVCVRPRLHSVTKGTGGSEGFLFTGSEYCLLSPEPSAYKCPVLADSSAYWSTLNQTIESSPLLIHWYILWILASLGICTF